MIGAIESDAVSFGGLKPPVLFCGSFAGTNE